MKDTTLPIRPEVHERALESLPGRTRRICWASSRGRMWKGVKWERCADRLPGSLRGDEMTQRYVHGYDFRENLRLQDQASTLVELLHSDTSFADGSSVIEGDHGSAYFYPDSRAAREAVHCQVELQKRAGGGANIGRRLFPLLTEAGYSDLRVSPRMVYADSSRPELVDGFVRKTFTAMVAAVRDEAVSAGFTDAEHFDRGIADLHRTAQRDGTFCYTFFKATGSRP